MGRETFHKGARSLALPRWWSVPPGTAEGFIRILQRGVFLQREHKTRQGFQTRSLSFYIRQPARAPSSSSSSSSSTSSPCAPW